MNDTPIAAAIAAAFAAKTPLTILGGGGKNFYGNPGRGEPLSTAALAGIEHYDPGAGAITVGAATLLSEVEETLAQHGQLLGFEPPHFGARATVGGTVACGFSGPRRPAAGALRDHILGVEIIDGRGRRRAGGNLAPPGKTDDDFGDFDLSPLMAAAMGTLGVLTKISLRATAKPEWEQTSVFELTAEAARVQCRNWRNAGVPLSGSVWYDGFLWARMAAGDETPAGGEHLSELDGDAFWRSVREQTHEYFCGEENLWRLAVPGEEPCMADEELTEWHGVVRWRRGGRERAMRAAKNGAAVLFRSADQTASGRFPPMPPMLAKMRHNLKNLLDPADILNRGRLHDFGGGRR